MKIEVIKTRDVLTPSLREHLATCSNPHKALEAMGLVIVSMAQRAFTNASLRPSAWAALSDATLASKRRAGYGSKPLINEGTLAASPRIVSVSSKNVTVGSDRPYAGYQQLGTDTIPGRPFFPFDDNGRPSASARRRMLSAAHRALKLHQK
jgi:phage gpG-like protein